MPQGFVPDEGAPGTILGMLGAPGANLLQVTLILWANNITPDFSVTVADLVEPTWAGYIRYPLDPAQWNAPVTSRGCTTATWGAQPVSWTVADVTTESVYGYALWDRANNLLRWCQRFEAADIRVPDAGGQFSMTPTITLTSAPC